MKRRLKNFYVNKKSKLFSNIMISQIETRKYNSIYRKKLVNKINKLKNKEYYIDVYNIIISDIGTNFSSNINGLFLNVNLLSNNCIEECFDVEGNYFV